MRWGFDLITKQHSFFNKQVEMSIAEYRTHEDQDDCEHNNFYNNDNQFEHFSSVQSSTLPLILHHCWMIALSVAGAETALPLFLAGAETALPLPLAGAETALSVAGAETALAQDS